jgi:serine O-acetyltransferase
MRGGPLKLVDDILFFKNYLLGEGPFNCVSSSVNLRDVIRFYRYRNGYFLTLLRSSEQLDKYHLGWLPRIFLNILFSSDISSGVSIGPCYFPHPFGIVIGGDVSIKGPVVLFNDINLGKAHPGLDEKMPTLESNVIVSCGARILGDISVGSNVIISANAVLSKDLAGGSTFINSNKIIESVYFLR